MTKINPDALKEWADAVMTRLPAGNPAHGLAEDAISRAFEEDQGSTDPAPDKAPDAQTEEAKWLPRSEPPASSGDAESSAPPADPVQRRNWLQRELDKLQGHA